MPKYDYLRGDHIEPVPIAVVGMFGNRPRNHVGALNQRVG